MITKTLTVLLAAALAVQAAPHVKRQGETALISSGTAPAGCRTVSTSLFGIGIHKATDVPKASVFARQVTQASDGQAAAPTAPVSVISDGQPQAPVSVISDGQPQAPATPVTVISDGQPQAPVSTMSMHPVSQIHDGQAQAYYSQPPVSQIGDGQVQAPTAAPVSQISDGQAQAPTAAPISQISDGQAQAPTGTPVSQISDGQAQVPTATAATQKSDGQPGASATNAPAPTPNVQMVACKTNSTLELTIENGVLYDGQRRQGYIAANYQFQFDAGVPQTGAIITSGFSICENGTLALGGSSIFWQCLSGTFYNLYDRDWAYQCEPVYLMALDLISC